MRENLPKERYEEVVKGNFDMKQLLKDAFPPLDYGNFIHSESSLDAHKESDDE